MSNGSTEDGDDLVAGRTNSVQSGTELLADQALLGDGRDFILQVKHDAISAGVGAIRAIAAKFGVIGEAGQGDGGGTGLTGIGKTGVVGRGEGNEGAPAETTTLGTGVIGTGRTGVEGRGANFGVQAVGGLAGVQGKGITGVIGQGSTTGLFGSAASGVGVRGESKVDDGVAGHCDANGKSGVFGFNSKTDGAAFGVVGRCESPGGTGVGGGSGPGVGVHGDSKLNNGVVGLTEASGRSGVFGENVGRPPNIAGPGVEAAIPFGVTGKADAGVGVLGTSGDGSGVSGKGGIYGGVFQGKQAPLRLVPSAPKGPPTVGRHESGEFVVDSSGALFFCIAGGTAGTWMRVQLVAP